MQLELKNVSKLFQSGKRFNSVLDDISFSVQTGEFVTLLGPSGCGKTMLLTIIAGFREA